MIQVTGVRQQGMSGDRNFATGKGTLDAQNLIDHALGADLVDDPILVSSERRVRRLVLAALETGSSFGRGDLEIEPSVWFTRPLELFGGLCAFDACQDRQHLERLIILHGLAIGDDGDARLIDTLRSNPGPTRRLDCRRGTGATRPELRLVDDEWRSQSTLWTASAHIERDDATLQVFLAMLAIDESATRVRIRDQYGEASEGEFEVRNGFDWSAPLANALVSGAMADVLGIAMIDPASSLAAGLDVRIEQRFAN